MADVKLFRSQRLTDNPDGGGLSTSAEVVDGEINNLFDDVSRIDRVNGRISLRKAFMQAVTEDTALFAGMHAIVQAPPQDERVSVVMFRTLTPDGRYSWSDERAQAQAAVERYLDVSVMTRMIPYDRQLGGQRSVLVFQRPELALPEIGQVYALEDTTTGQVEFIAVQNLEHEVQTFTTNDLHDYQARVITLTLTQPLTREFTGSQPNRSFVAATGASVLRRTIVSDAARYRGIVRLAADAAPGDTSIKVESVYTQLVPSAMSEIGIVDAQPGGVEMGVAAATSGISVSWIPTTGGRLKDVLPLPGSLLEGTLRVTYGSLVASDVGGRLVLDGRTLGSIDHANGRVVVTDTYFGPSSGGLTFVASYTPAGHVTRPGFTDQIPVDISNRGYVYARTLSPLPAPGSLRVSYRALGTWYTLQDSGDGVLAGDAGVGSGVVNYATGSVALTCGAMPDIGSSVLFAWGTPAEFIAGGGGAPTFPSIEHQLEAASCRPGTLAVTWSGGSASDDGAGNITGSATGRVYYASGRVVLRPTTLPTVGATTVTFAYEIDYEEVERQEEQFNLTMVAGSVQMTVAEAPLLPGTVEVSYTVPLSQGFESYYYTRTFTDDGEGGLQDDEGVAVPGSVVNYSTGFIGFVPTFVAKAAAVRRESGYKALPQRTASPSLGYYSTADIDAKWLRSVLEEPVTVSFPPGTLVTVRYTPDVDPPEETEREETVAMPPMRIDLTPGTTSPVVPGSVIFNLGGRQYFDRQGTLYYGVDPRGGAPGTAGGSINYATGEATLTTWGTGAASVSIVSMLTQPGALPLEVVNGRVPARELRPATFGIRAVRQRDGSQISATADNNGNISTSAMHGYVDVTTGVFSVAFGAYVLDSTLTPEDRAEDWYDASQVAGDGYIWRPDPAIPGTVYYNAVARSRLPLDPEIIGINPVRLPMDGRVQAIRAGDTLVIHDTLPTPLTGVEAGSTHSLGRTGSSSVAVYDGEGLGLPQEFYALDAVAGEITFADPLDLGGYTPPFTALDTVEEMALCLDAQITGEVALGTALTHGFTADNSYCSSALVLGDMRARYEALFAQSTWTNVWSDSLIGSAPSSGAQYNDVTYPIEVTNRDAITQRWRLQFTSSTAFNVVAEELGIIATGTTSGDVAPVNPATGEPYFTLRKDGFGAGWATGNAIRFNTVAAGAPFWVARTVLSGPALGTDDYARLQLRWDKD